MADLPVAHRAALAQLVATCPDAALARLALAVDSLGGDKGRAVAALVREAARDRDRRRVAFAAVEPLFAPRRDRVAALTFPAPVLTRVWRIAADREPAILTALDQDEGWGPVADRLCQAAASAVRDHADEVWPASLDPEGRETGLVELAGCFDLAHLVRTSLPNLPHWIGRPDGDQVADLRLLVRDASAIAPDGARRVMDILLAHLADASLILRVVTQSSGAAGRESFLSASELAGCIERLIDAVQARAEKIEAFKPPKGDVADVIADVTWSATTLSELDLTLSLQADGAWGRRIRESRVRLASQMAGLLKSAEKAVSVALPMTRVQMSGRMTRQAPRLDAPATGAAIEAALTFMDLVGRLRGAAAVFGCEADRRGLVERLVETLSTYADEALSMVNGGEAPDEANAIALIEQAAEMLTRIEAVDAARTIRRRVAVAGPDRSTAVA